MYKTRYSLPGSPPATLSPLVKGGRLIKPSMRVVEYDLHEVKERSVPAVAELPEDIDDGVIRWIEFNGLGDVDALRELGEKYHLHPLALEDVLNTGQRAKLETYEKHLFLVLQMIYRDQAGKLCAEQISLFVNRTMVISIQEEAETDVFTPVRGRILSGGGKIRRMRGDYLGYALVDSIVDHTFPIMECIGEALEELETKLLEHPMRSHVAQLHEFRRSLLYMRRAIWPQREVVNSLLHDESGMVSKDIHVFLRDCYDHTVQIMDFVESYRDFTGNLMEIYLSSVGMRTNEVMRVLTVISAIFIPLTFVAGVYGMNFENMPELKRPEGYFFCLGAMVLIAVGQLYYFKVKKWL
jgi:magnesium transporter